MAYWDRRYHVSVVLGAAQGEPIWTWGPWQVVARILAPLVSVARDRAAVRTLQFAADGKTPIRFGRIGWNESGHQKWVHASPTNAHQSSAWQFLDAELWAPAWTTCDRDGLPPDLFFGVRNLAHRTQSVKFSPLMILAVASDLLPDPEASARHASQALSDQLGGKLAVYQNRPWGKPMYGGFTDAINDLLTVGLFKLGDPQDRPVDETTFVESWHRLPRATLQG